MPLSGSQQAYKPARFGVMRFGASRFGYFPLVKIVSINGTDRAAYVEPGSLHVRQELNEEPDTADFTIVSNSVFVPTNGQTVIVSIGTSGQFREFAGQINQVTSVRKRMEFAPWYQVRCIDWSKQFNRRRVQTYYESQSATDIVKSVIDTYTSGFTYDNVQAGLATVDFLPAALDTPMETLRRIANKIGGGFYIDPYKDVHFFGSAGETGPRAPTPPLTITNASRVFLLNVQKDRNDLRTRNLVETKGAQTVADVAVGQTGIPLEDANEFNVGSCDALIEEYGVLDFSLQAALSAALGATTADAAVGDTTLGIDTNPIGLGGLGVGIASWLKIANQYIWCTGYTGTGPWTLTGIPSTGAGSIRTAIPTGTQYQNQPQIGGIAGGVTRAIPQGTYVSPLTTVDDAAAQATQTGIEGGDGIHEHTIRDRRFNQSNADDLGNEDLDKFSTNVERVMWETTDLNARVGAQQVFNITGTDSYSATLTITSVDVNFIDEVPHALPHRTCEASVVRLANLVDQFQQDESR